MTVFTVVQVNVGTPALLGQQRGRDVYSSIKKRPVTGPSVMVHPLGVEGDEQADKREINGKRVHGGVLQAVYAYPVEHLPLWMRELGIDLLPAAFGENLSVLGTQEGDVCIGDEYRCGGLVLRVTKPRRPCYKLPMHLGVPDAPQRMNANGLCGWYFSVVTPGALDTNGTFELVRRPVGATTVAAAYAAKVRANPSIPGPPEDE